jgi:hypothetical protein
MLPSLGFTEGQNILLSHSLGAFRVRSADHYSVKTIEGKMASHETFFSDGRQINYSRCHWAQEPSVLLKPPEAR